MNKLPTTLLVVLVMLACVGGGLYYYKYDSRGRYHATTKFQILQSNAPDTFSSVPADLRNWMDVQIAVISSRANLARVVNHLHLDTEWSMPADSAVQRLEKQIKVTFERGTEIVSVTAWADKADMAAAIANDVREMYGKRRIEAEVERFRRLTKNV